MEYVGSKKDLDYIIDLIINKDINLEPLKLKNLSKIDLREYKEEIFRKKRQLNIHNQESKNLLEKFHKFSKRNHLGLRSPKIYSFDIAKSFKLREYREKVRNSTFSYIAGKNNSLKFKEMFYVLENYKREYDIKSDEYVRLDTLYRNGKIINNELKKKRYLRLSQINIIRPQKGYYKSIQKILDKDLVYKIENKEYLIIFSFYTSKEIVDSLKGTKTIDEFYTYNPDTNFSNLREDLKYKRREIEHLYRRLLYINYKSNYLKKLLLKLQLKLKSLKNIYCSRTMVIISTKKIFKNNNMLFFLHNLKLKDIELISKKTKLYLEEEYKKQSHLIELEKEKIKYELEYKKQEFLNDLENKLNTQRSVYEEVNKISFDKFYSGFEDYLLTHKKFSETFCKKIKKIVNKDEDVIFKANPEVVHFFNEILLSNNIIVTIFLDYSEKGLACYKNDKKIFEFDFSIIENYAREVYEKI